MKEAYDFDAVGALSIGASIVALGKGSFWLPVDIVASLVIVLETEGEVDIYMWAKFDAAYGDTVNVYAIITGRKFVYEDVSLFIPVPGALFRRESGGAGGGGEELIY